MTHELNTLSDEELQRHQQSLQASLQATQAEVERRQALIEEAARQKRVVLAQAVFEARDKLLPTLEHERTSCSDTKHGNGYTTEGRKGAPRCFKCMLMRLSLAEVMDGSVEFSLGGRYTDISVHYRD